MPGEVDHQPASVGRLVGSGDLIAIGELFDADIGRRLLRGGEHGCEEGEGEGDCEEARVGHRPWDEPAWDSIFVRVEYRAPSVR